MKSHAPAPPANRRPDGGFRASRVPAAGRRVTASFLLRFWAEPRESTGARPRLGSFVSRLGTEDEHYFGDFQSLVAWLEEYLGREFADAVSDDEGGPATWQPGASRRPHRRPGPAGNSPDTRGGGER